MTSERHFEHDLPDLLADLFVESLPDYRYEVLRQTARTPQRLASRFPEGWLPMSVMTLTRQTFRPLPPRTIALLAALAVLIAGSLAVYVGTRPRLPAPFGLAANGLVAYGLRGDIFAVDPATGARRALVTGPEADHDPRWSRDGTRLAFLRATRGGHLPVIAAADGTLQVVAKTEPLVELDSDSVAWSPDGRSIAFVGGDGVSAATIHILDTTSGDVATLAAPYLELEVHWRPPHGRELLFLGVTAAAPGLHLVSLDDGTTRQLPIPGGNPAGLRPLGWTPDGQRLAFHRLAPGGHGGQTHVVDVATGAEVVIDAEFGHLSNDGSRIVGIVGAHPQTLCVASTAGGQCIRIGRMSDRPDGTHGEGLQWSPDDRWIVSQPFYSGSQGAVILDPSGKTPAQRSWSTEGVESWQRLAP